MPEIVKTEQYRNDLKRIYRFAVRKFGPTVALEPNARSTKPSSAWRDGNAKWATLPPGGQIRVMKKVIPGLYASAPQWLPFAPSLDIRSFLLQRKQGNVLVYSVSELDAGEPEIQDLGGIDRQYLSHRHEAMFVSERMNAPIYCHQKERASVSKKVPVTGTFSERTTLDGNFEVIPIPGHTSGATAFLWDSGTRRVLFTGDTIYLDEGEWVAAVLDSSDRAAYIESLVLIRELDFDVLVPWAATNGQPYHALTDRSATRRRVGHILDRVRRDENR